MWLESGPLPDRGSDMNETKLLLVIDESEASSAAVGYVARTVGRRRGFHLCLAHVFPTLPPELLEFGGAENPKQAQSLDARHKADLEAWIAAAKETGGRALAAARRILRKAGVAAAAPPCLCLNRYRGSSMLRR